MEKHLENLKNSIFVFQELERTIIKLRKSNSEISLEAFELREKLKFYE
jgi:hypothetical protein